MEIARPVRSKKPSLVGRKVVFFHAKSFHIGVMVKEFPEEYRIRDIDDEKLYFTIPKKRVVFADENI